MLSQIRLAIAPEKLQPSGAVQPRARRHDPAADLPQL